MVSEREMLLLCLLLMLGVWGQSEPVQPLLACWFHSYSQQQRIFNLVMSYNNTDDVEQMIPLVFGENAITPSAYDGVQPDLYKVGLHPFVFVITDTQNNGTITWQLGNTTLIVITSQLTIDTRCDHAFQGTCPGNITGFCEDSSYCNGQELCFSGNFFVTSPTGVCTAPSQGVQCLATQQCQEPVGCVNTPAPTNAPTKSPTRVPTSKAPTKAPTMTPTAPTGAPTYETVDILVRLNCWFVGRINSSYPLPLMQISMDYVNPSSTTVERPVTQTMARLTHRKYWY